MEFVFGLIGLLVGASMLLAIPYMIYGSWIGAKRALKCQFDGNGELGILNICIGLMVAILIFILLCGFNNSIWHMDYLTTEGLWKK